MLPEDDLTTNTLGINKDVLRYMRMIKELDVKYNKNKKLLDSKYNTVITNKKGKNEPVLKEIKELQSICLGLQNQKVDLARQAEQVVEKMLDKLKNDHSRLVVPSRGMDSAGFDEGHATLGKREKGSNSHNLKNDAEGGDSGAQEVYCFCHQHRDDTLIGCDDPKCRIQWFHMNCVNLSKLPPSNSEWYCKECLEKRKKNKQKS